MKYNYAIAIALMLLGTAASAATPDEAFIAERDALIAKFNPPGDPPVTDAVSKDVEKAQAELAKRLRGMIGPLNVKGFSGDGEYTGSLFKGEMEFGMLDGLMFSKGKETQLVVTTTGLASLWIKSPEGFAGNDSAAAKDLPSAMQRDGFYTRATVGDSGVSNMGVLPVTKPAGVEFAYAMLSLRRQDTLPGPAGEMLVGVIAPPRVYVLSAPIAKIKMMPECAKLLNDANAKADKLEKSAKASDADAIERIRDQGDEAMRRCFAEHVKNGPAFARLTTQAQEFVNMLAAK